MSAITTVDKALDRYVAARRGRGIEPEGFYAKTLAKFAGIRTGEMSNLLQQYRYAQRRQGATRYVIGAQGYGSKARWRILAKPGSDPVVVQEARREQAMWIARDGLNRIVKDTLHEVLPGLTGSDLDELIEREVKTMTEHMDVSVRALERSLV